MTELKSFAHTFLIVLAVLFVYNSFVKSFTPTFIQSGIGI